MLGRWVENKLSEHDKQGKPIHKLSDLLKPIDDKPQKSEEYASLAGLVTKKMVIPPSGIW